MLTGVTDVLDGRLARARNEVTRFGTLADPLADKLMVLVAVFALTARGSVPRWVAVLLAAKELVQIVGAGFFLVSKSKVTPANSAGKLATVLLYIGITGGNNGRFRHALCADLGRRGFTDSGFRLLAAGSRKIGLAGAACLWPVWEMVFSVWATSSEGGRSCSCFS